jgi:dTDP-L-rhamnose 4-epimerase
MTTSKRILVTGGAGFIGSHLVDALVKEGHKVQILDNLEPQVHSEVPPYLNASASFIQGDIRSDENIKAALKDIEVVFHHTAAVGVGQSMYQIQKYVDINCGGTAKLLDNIVNGKYDIEKLIVASSMSIYGEGSYSCGNCGIVYPKQRTESQLEAGQWDLKCPKCNQKLVPLPTDEDKPLYPTSVYAVSKRDQEELSLSVGRAYKIPTVALRYFNVYGPRQSLSNPYTGVCAIFLSRIKNNKRPLIFEDGTQSRDFVSVHDIVQANLLAMNKKEADYEALNVGTGKPISIIDIARLLIKLCGKDLEPEVISRYRAGDIRHCYPDISRIKSKLGYSPQVDLEEGMKELFEWGEYTEAVDNTAAAQEELTSKGLIQ